MAVRATTETCTPASVAAARDWSRHTLDVVCAGFQRRRDLVDDAVLVVSELVTNALRAGCTRHTLMLAADTTSLTITVTDDADGWPQARDAGPAEPGGRGLGVVTSLTTAWGTDAGSGGKSVWAELPIA